MKILHNVQKNSGFTLIETMIAVFILVVAMVGLLGLISSSLFAARYAKNDIIANYLVQEAIDSIRNDRDTFAFQKVADTSIGGWSNFRSKYSSCFNSNGCEIEPALGTISACNPSSETILDLPCRVLNYNDTDASKDYYTYATLPGNVKSNFKRQVIMSINSNNNPDELDIKVTVQWLNGNLVKSRSSRVSLLNWLR